MVRPASQTEHPPGREPWPDPTAVFAAVLTPHRSLRPTGFLILMVAIGSVSFAAGLLFLLLGAWPVFGFFGLDVLLIYAAFRLNYRSGRAYELVEVTPQELRLTFVDPAGRARRHCYNPHWVRVELEQRRGATPILKLISRGRELIFAGCLNEEEKRAFADALRDGLGAVKGPRI